MTWISYISIEISGPEILRRAGPMFFTNLLIHAINVVVLFLALQADFRLVAEPGQPSSSVASCRPSRWLGSPSGRTSSSSLFLLLDLVGIRDAGAFAALGCYGLVIVLFLIGLSAKPMLVSLPVLLCSSLIYWPLRRLQL